VLEELAITVQAQLGERLPLPFCAFNGGADVFVDLGNKSLGLEAIMNYLDVRPHQVCCFCHFSAPPLANSSLCKRQQVPRPS